VTKSRETPPKKNEDQKKRPRKCRKGRLPKRKEEAFPEHGDPHEKLGSPRGKKGVVKRENKSLPQVETGKRGT